MQKKEKIEFDAFVRKQPNPFDPFVYGRITAKELSGLVGKKVKVTIEPLEDKV